MLCCCVVLWCVYGVMFGLVGTRDCVVVCRVCAVVFVCGVVL